MKQYLALIVTCSIFLIVSCKSTTFVSSSSRKPLPENTQPIIVDCLKETPTNYSLDIRGDAKTKFVVQGKVCPNMDDIFTKKTIVVMIDHSGSMTQNDPGNGNSCYRLDAVRALVNKVKSTEKALDNVFVSLIGFASDAKVLLSPTSVNNVDGLINYGSICQADGFTDYQAAVNAATSILQNVDGAKDVYFISDGMPYKDTEEPTTSLNKGLEAAAQLRAIPETELFVLYLRDMTGVGGNPQEYLTQFAGGDASKVKVVVQADKLVDEILKFDVKPAPMIAVLNPTISVAAQGFKPRAIEIESIEPDLSQKSVWNYESIPFLPNSSKDFPVDNIVTIKMVDNNGRQFLSTVTVRFSYKTSSTR